MTRRQRRWPALWSSWRGIPSGSRKCRRRCSRSWATGPRPRTTRPPALDWPSGAGGDAVVPGIAQHRPQPRW
jgi:hypothetical protein